MIHPHANKIFLNTGDYVNIFCRRWNHEILTPSGVEADGKIMLGIGRLYAMRTNWKSTRLFQVKLREIEPVEDIFQLEKTPLGFETMDEFKQWFLLSQHGFPPDKRTLIGQGKYSFVHSDLRKGWQLTVRRFKQ